MDIRSTLKGQYHAALATLQQAIAACPPRMWLKGDDPVPFWHVAYHTLFFTHLYLQVDAAAFKPWKKHREKLQSFRPVPPSSRAKPRHAKAYTKREIMEYWRACDAMVDGAVDAMDLTAAKCGFWWYKLPKLDHQIVNIRHIQHHAAILAARLRRAGGKEIRWIAWA